MHATLQIVHFDTDAQRPDSAWVRGVNAHLARDIAVLWAQPVAGRVPRALRRDVRATTRIFSCSRATRPALLAGRVGWYHRPLDVGAMREAAAALAGTHDFSAFRAAECQATSPVKTLSHVAVAADGEFVRFDFSANAFLHHMIRNIVGALVYVGAGKEPATWIADLLAARDRTRAAPTFAADGLYFDRRRLRREVGPAADQRRRCVFRSHDGQWIDHANARQDLRHHARRGRPRRGATPAPTRSASSSGPARRAW